MVEVPIIESLSKWLKEHDPDLHVRMSENGQYFNLYHYLPKKTVWLGHVTLIYPGQDLKQALQYDWYKPEDDWPLIDHDPKARYLRKVFSIADPAGFPEILETARNIRAGLSVKWHQVFRSTPKGIVLIEEESNA